MGEFRKYTITLTRKQDKLLGVLRDKLGARDKGEILGKAVTLLAAVVDNKDALDILVRLSSDKGKEVG